jgi:hypothetical protein
VFVFLLVLEFFSPRSAHSQRLTHIRSAAGPLFSPDTLAVAVPCLRHNAKSDDPRLLEDPLQAELAAKGKEGATIEQARDRVLEILQSENSCSAWYRQKTILPAATFRTLNFAVDRKGPEWIVEWRENASLVHDKYPYVASVVQEAGEHAVVTINATGAFFHSTAVLRDDQPPPGSSRLLGFRPLRVGPYPGNSLAAQVLSLLHEFGHVVGLLPLDFGDVGGKSMENTREVLRHCRAQIDVIATQTVSVAAR